MSTRDEAVGAAVAAVPGLARSLTPMQEAGIVAAFMAGREAAACDIEATGNYERQARIAREGLRPGEATR